MNLSTEFESVSGHGGFGGPVVFRQSDYEKKLSDLLALGCKERQNLLEIRQSKTVELYRELGILRSENYSLVTKPI